MMGTYNNGIAKESLLVLYTEQDITWISVLSKFTLQEYAVNVYHEDVTIYEKGKDKPVILGVKQQVYYNIEFGSHSFRASGP